MSSNSGEIYFIREQSHSGSDLTPLVKIGLVRQHEGRSSYERVQEHQTGNPRTLVLTDRNIIFTDAVDHVEAQLHRRFAPNRISGEWFEFNTSSELDAALADAKGLAAEMSKLRPLFEQAEILQVTPDDGEIADASEDDLMNATDLLIAKERVKICKTAKKPIEELIKKTFESGVNVGTAAKSGTKTFVSKFDEAKFKQDYPEQYDEFLIKSSSWYQRFYLDSKIAKSTDVKKFSAFNETQNEITRIDTQTINMSSPVKINGLNDLLLEITQLQVIAEWDQEVAEAKLKQACGTQLGIKNICKWQRSDKIKSVFDTESFSKKHPEQYIDYLLDPVTKTYIRLTNVKTRTSN